MNSVVAARAVFPSVHDQVAAIDAATLAPVVRRLLDDPGAVLGTWRCDEIGYWLHNPTRAGIFRFQGEAAYYSARAPSSTVPWSLILRVAQAPGPDHSGNVPDDWKYWRREELLVRAGLLHGLPGAFAAPRCYGAQERPDGRVWLWQDDLGHLQAAWSIDRLVLAARHLGQFHGVYLEGSGVRPLPDTEWLSRHWLSRWMERLANFPRSVEPLLARTDVWEQPLLRELFPPAFHARIAQLWADRGALLAGLGRLPRTLCHNDAWPGNLFDTARPVGGPAGGPAGEPRTTAIDWEFAGPGGIGTDLGQFLFGCQSGLYLDLGTLEAYHAFKERALSAYLDGVRETAARLPVADTRLDQQVRFGCAARAALQWGWAFLPWIVGPLTKPETALELEERTGLPIEDISRRRALALAFANDLGDEARALLSTN